MKFFFFLFHLIFVFISLFSLFLSICLYLSHSLFFMQRHMTVIRLKNALLRQIFEYCFDCFFPSFSIACFFFQFSYSFLSFSFLCFLSFYTFVLSFSIFPFFLCVVTSSFHSIFLFILFTLYFLPSRFLFLFFCLSQYLSFSFPFAFYFFSISFSFSLFLSYFLFLYDVLICCVMFFPLHSFIQSVGCIFHIFFLHFSFLSFLWIFRDFFISVFRLSLFFFLFFIRDIY